MGPIVQHRGVGRLRAAALALGLLIGLGTGRVSPGDSSTPLVSVPKRASSAIALTPDGETLLVVNPDSNTLSLLDLLSHDVTELTVGVDPRTVAVDDVGDRAYVANRGSSSVSAIDLAARAVITEVAVGARPYGVLAGPSGNLLYVTEQGTDRLRILDTKTFATCSLLDTADRPSGLALSPDGDTLYVTHLLSNTITVIRLREHTVYLPLVLRTMVTGSQLPLAGWSKTMPTANACEVHRQQLTASSILLFPDSNLVQAIVPAPTGSLAYIPHTRSRPTNENLTFDTTVSPLVSIMDMTTRQHLVGQQIDLGTLDPPGVGLPTDAAVSADGELWVVNAASNDLSVVDLTTRRLAAHIEVGDNPRGIVMAYDGATAYVNNTLGGTVSVIDMAAYTVTDVVTVTQIPLPPMLLNGKRLFHSSDDPRMSYAQWISCNTCHFEGEQDARTWVFGFAGPRNTTSLLGMIETYPLRWSGEWDESADSEFANRKENFGSGLVEGDMYCTLSPPNCVSQPPNQGRSYDLDSLAAFIDSLQTLPSPGHVHGEPLTPAEARGKALFENAALGCTTCHAPPLYTDLLPHDVGTATTGERIGPAYDTPSLRALYDSAPYFHDGSAPTLHDALTRDTPGSEHDLRGTLTEEELDALIAFLLALPYE